jgi:DNA-binding response OmpR family regulator
MMHAAASALAPGAAPAAAPGAGAPTRDLVLVLEDNESIAGLLRTLLATLGLRVHWCPRGADALTEFAQHQKEIALILADCRLPDGDGRVICAKLRQRDPVVPVLVCSGNVRCDNLGPLREDNRTGFLPKPYRPAEVLGRVRILLAGALPVGTASPGFVC